jgi:hypothetical protein
MKDNMEGSYAFTEFSPARQRVYEAATQAYQAYQAALQQTRAFRGSRHWKRIKGRDYLYQYHDRYGHGRSLGARSPHTEELFAQFRRESGVAAQGLKDRRRDLAEQARFCRAALINRLPRVAARILRRLEQHETRRNFFVIGTAAIYAYEFATGVFLESLGPRDLLGDAGRRLTLAGGGMSRDDLLRLLRQADRSFAPLPGDECRAANRDGFLVKILKSEIKRPGKPKTLTVAGAREPLPPEAGNLQYLAASPKLTQVVIGKDGGPVTLVVPDPRAFALNRLWLSQQEDRGEDRRARDLGQALAVADLVLRYLPQYDFSSSELEMFPRELGRSPEDGDAMALIEDAQEVF